MTPDAQKWFNAYQESEARVAELEADARRWHYARDHWALLADREIGESAEQAVDRLIEEQEKHGS